MKKFLIFFCFLLLFPAGCGSRSEDLDEVLDLRQSLLKGEGYSFTARVTADYGDRIYSFVMECKALSTGDVEFTVIEPETIKGITGIISQGNGKLTFDNQVLLFEPIINGQLTPVIAPWLVINAIQSGYIRSVSTRDSTKEITIDDTFSGESFWLTLLVQQNQKPSFCEVFWDNRRILSVKIEDFNKL